MTITLRSGTRYGPQTPEAEDVGNQNNRTGSQDLSAPGRQEHLRSGALGGLLQIGEMTQRIARHADPDTVIALAGAARGIRAALGPENQAAVFEKNASSINTGPAFHGALARLPPIPENFRDGPLSVLGGRIPHLPTNEQQPALVAWLPVAQQQRRRSGLLNELVLAGAQGPAGMRQAPLLAVQRGDNVQLVAQRLGITTAVDIDELERSAIYSSDPASAGSAVRRGENVQAVAQRHGITTPAGIERLEGIAIYSMDPASARSAVRRGENVQAVAQRHGITTPGNIDLLEQNARWRS